MRGGSSVEERRFLILCIEDEAQLRRDIADELGEAGYDVIEAGGGDEALKILAETCPDLVLCDISMPGLSGYDVLNALQGLGSDHAEIPFMFLSALADPRQIVDGKRRGADDYLVKPVDYDLLLATVDARLRQIKRIRSARTVAPALDVAALFSSFGLTPAEARVALTIAEGKTLSEAATKFNISRTTIAFHLRNIFTKTGTRRQGELIALLLHHGGFREQAL